MKRFLLLVLTCGMYVSAFTKPIAPKSNIVDSSVKWVIYKLNAKTSTGKLFVILPKGTEWDMTIYAAGTTKVLSNTALKTSFILQPGLYDLEINHIWIRGVPVEKGNETRLKAGVLHIPEQTSWTLYDEVKEKVLINSLSASKRGLPIGKYKLTLNGQDQDIEIKDENAEEESNNNLNNRDILTDLPNAMEKWVITDLPGKSSMPEKGAKGKLDVNFMGNSSWSMRVTKDGTAESFELTGNGFQHMRDKSYELAPGNYDIKLNNVTIENVPIEGNRKTRLKAGSISINYATVNGPILYVKCYVYDKNEAFSSTSFFFMANSPLTKIVPAGNYGLRVWGDYPLNSVLVKDKENRLILINTSTLTINASGILWRLCNVDQSVLPCYFLGGNGTQKLNLPVGNYKLWYGAQSVTVNVNATTQNSVSIPQ